MTAPARDGSGPRRIGAVLAELREEFPDATASKIRFLEAEGLLQPARSPRGYRLYDAADVARLRYVLAAQRDFFWPLKVIAAALEVHDRGLEPVVSAGEDGLVVRGRARRGPVTAPALPVAGAARLTLEELGDGAGLDRTDITALTEAGLLRPDGIWYSAEDLSTARAAAGLARHGVELRHLRAFRAAADRESGLVAQAVAGRRGKDARAAAEEIAGLCVELHRALLATALRQGD